MLVSPCQKFTKMSMVHRRVDRIDDLLDSEKQLISISMDLISKMYIYMYIFVYSYTHSIHMFLFIQQIYTDMNLCIV